MMTGPRNQCMVFFKQRKISEPLELSKEEFDRLSRDYNFAEGPFKESFGDGYGEPYNPWRQAFGITEDNRGVYCELYRESWPVGEEK